MNTTTSELFLVQYGSPNAPRLGIETDGIAYALRKPITLSMLLSGEWAAAADLIGKLLALRADPLDWAIHAPLPPISDQDVWATGVTYKRSEEAREAESKHSTLYTRVYHAARPELFFKARGGDVVGQGAAVGIRRDAVWSVPEPELVVVLNARLETVGFTIGNDMSSRDIEGENPLYLPQAKVYEKSCAIGSRLWLQPGRAAWPLLSIQLSIRRADALVFESTTSTENLKRTLPELAEYLGRCKHFHTGVYLFTGTGIVPPDSFTLQAGDVITIQIDPLGSLTNHVETV